MSLDKLIGDLQKVYGVGSVGTAHEVVKSAGGYSTGSIQLDATLGGEGFPRGRLTEVGGPTGSGKTTMSLNAVKSCQEAGDKAIFVDLEGTFDKVYAQSLGVNLDELIIIPPTSGEDAMMMAEKLCKTGEIGLLVVDSIAAMLPGKISEDEYGKANMAFHAKLVGEFVKRFVPIQYKHKIAVLVLNQIRLKPGVSFGCLHGDTLIPTIEYGPLPIREIVDKRVEARVWSFNEKERNYEAQPILDWFYNGDVEEVSDYLTITSEGPEGENELEITVTPNHKVMSESGWKEARDLKVGELVLAPGRGQVFSAILHIVECSESKLSRPAKYDIQVKNNSNYLAGGMYTGILVHNSPEYLTGGESLPFYAAVRIDIRKSGAVYKDSEGNIIGEPRKIKIVKSKINASVNQQMMIDIIYGEGVDNIGEVLDACVDLGWIGKSGSWFSYEGAKIGQGRAATKRFLEDNPEVYEELRDKLYKEVFVELSANQSLEQPPE